MVASEGAGSLAAKVLRVGSPTTGGWGAVAVKRGLVFRAGERGSTCAAMEVAIERGTEGREGSMRGIRECTSPATVEIHRTHFCDDCGDAIARSSNVAVVDRIVPGRAQ
jgi:hypothetical protein